MFNTILWNGETVSVNQHTFHLQVHLQDDIRPHREGFVFYKDKKLIDMYASFFQHMPATDFEKVLEIGMWDGGSAVFWHQVLQPKTLIGVDLMANRGASAFERYKKEHVSSFFDHWEVDQTDETKLTRILDEHLGGEELDLVFDDASHRYQQSLASFNIVFPRLKKGGYYIIEDWAWGHWVHEDSSAYPPFTEPTRLITELVEAAANVGLIESVYVCSGFTAIKRGHLEIPKVGFHLHNFIYRRPIPLTARIKRRAKMMLGRK